MEGAGPSAVIAKYAVVRPPKGISPERLKLAYVHRPDDSTAFWEKLSAFNDEASFDEIEQAARQCLYEQGDLQFSIGDFNLAEAIASDAHSLAGPARGEGQSVAVQLLRDKYGALVADEEARAAAKALNLLLWDVMSATAILPDEHRDLGPVLKMLKILHAAEYVSSLPARSQADPAALDAEIIMPDLLVRLISQARSGRRAEGEAGRENQHNSELANARAEVTNLLLAVSAGYFMEAAVQSQELTFIEEGPVDEADDGEGDTRTSFGGRDARATLSDRQIAGLHAEIVGHFKNVFGIADLATEDAILLLDRTRRFAADAMRRATLTMGAAGIVEATARLEQAASLISSQPNALLAPIVDELTEQFPRLGSLRRTHDPLPRAPGKIKPAGYGDLRVVRQQLQKYELGEIAYVENVLAGEERTRAHIRTERTEQQTVTEVEEGAESERDLQTTERFQLSQELESIQKESRNSEAGINVTARYGAVTVAAHAQTQSADAAEQAQRNARNYMKESVARAVQRVQKRVRTEKMISFSAETRESNIHKFSALGTESRVGVYRYVEKHYFCQTLNYGSRLMIEFWVPEPSAYFVYAQQQGAKTEGQMIAPEKPNIDASRITDYNYLALAAQFNAEVTEPPASMQYGGALHASNKSQDASAEKYTTPDGYEIVRAYGNFVFVSARGQNPPPSLHWFVGRHGWNTSSWQSQQYISPAVRGDVTVRAMTFQNISSWMIGVTFALGRTSEVYQKWQLETYNAIMLAYRLAKDEYDRKVNAAEQDSRARVLRTEAAYRSIEQAELRRGAIELLTNQHFDGFSSIDLINKVPTINNANAETEGKIVRFFEHGFEWDNMVYTFYPYYWSRKSSWPAKLSIADADPLHQRFLEAGFARVVVPVRKGYEKHLSLYLATGDIWPDGEVPTLGSPEYLSIIDEIKENDAALSSNPDLEGIAEGAPWRVVLPTPLVCLESDKLKLPTWEIRPPGKPIPYVPSERLCDGLSYNAAQWPDLASVRVELKLLGYGVVETGSADTYFRTPEGNRVVRSFQRRANELGFAARLGRPLRVDGDPGPCTLRVLSVAAEARARGEWPGPGLT